MSIYRAAIDQTTHAIERRTRYFRNQAIAVVLVSAISVVWALVDLSFLPLLGVVLLVPICGAFLLADSQLLEGWRAGLLKMWIRRELDCDALRDAIRAIQVLPRNTTEGMLLTLPSAGSLVAEQRVSATTRQAVAAATLASYRARSDAIVLKVVASVIVGGTLIACVTTHRLEPLAALMSLVLLPVARWWMRRWRLAASTREVIACRARGDFSERDYARLVAGLN